MSSTIKPTPAVSTAQIFLIDDEEIVLETFSAFLQERGFTNLHRFTSASDAIRMLRCLRPDLILTDVHMPEFSGGDLTKLVREFEHLESIPVVAITADDRPETLDFVLQQGADAVMVKPVTVDELVTTVETYVSQ